MHRLLLTIIGTGLSASVFAAMPFPLTEQGSVCIPKLCSGFVIGVTGYYMQPFANNGDESYAAFNSVDSNGIKKVDRDYDWGWSVNAGYIFCNTPFDININYFNFDTKDKDSLTEEGLNAIVPINNLFNFPFNLPDILDATYNNKADASISYNINQIDLSVGQILNITHSSYIHPFIGLRCAQLRRNINTHYFQSTRFFTETEITQIQDTHFDEKSRFQGIGPLAGFDVGYGLSCGFGLAGHFKGALLLGKTNFSTNELVSQRLNVGPLTNFVSDSVNIYSDSINRVVPATDIKLGINWRCFTKQNCNSNLMIEAGWQLTHYYHQSERLQTNSVIQNGFVDPLIAATQATGRFTSNGGFNGPYIGLTFRS